MECKSDANYCATPWFTILENQGVLWRDPVFAKLLTSGSGNAAAITKENLDLDFKASESRHRSATRHPVKCRQWKSIVVVSTEPPSIPHQPPDVINASSSSLEFPWPAGLETPSFKIKFAHWFTRGEGKLIKEEYKKLCFLLFFPLHSHTHTSIISSTSNNST